ncbi:MAG: hypothetical protein ACREA2_12370, partial [Blastocatellia bacterium]
QIRAALPAEFEIIVDLKTTSWTKHYASSEFWEWGMGSRRTYAIPHSLLPARCYQFSTDQRHIA